MRRDSCEVEEEDCNTQDCNPEPGLQGREVNPFHSHSIGVERVNVSLIG